MFESLSLFRDKYDLTNIRYITVKISPSSKATIKFNKKVLVTDVYIYSPSPTYITLSTGDKKIAQLIYSKEEPMHEKELIGFAELFVFKIPIYRIKKKKPLHKYFYPIECDTITLTSEGNKPIYVTIIFASSIGETDIDYRIET